MAKGRALTALLVALALGACFKLDLPSAAQIRCAADEPRCPDGWSCCDGWCRPACAPPACDGGPTCGLAHALDCDAGRICLGGCWSACPGCAELCADTSLKICQAAVASETWLCRRQETCVVRESSAELIADCHAGPPQCQGERQADCDCLTGPYAIYPPCAPQETCLNSTSSCVICALRGDAGPGRDVEVTREAGVPAEAGSTDAAWPGQDASSSVPDVPEDYQDAAGGLLDAVEGVDGGTPLGPTTDPECYDLLDEGPAGVSCCEVDAVLASFASGQAACEPGATFPTACDGYGQSCVSGAPVGCDPQDPCVWAWIEGSVLYCADYGPSSPCVDGRWSCVAGTLPLSRCPG